MLDGVIIIDKLQNRGLGIDHYIEGLSGVLPTDLSEVYFAEGGLSVVKLSLCLPLEDVLAGRVLSDPLSRGVGDSHAEVNDIC